MRKKCPNCGNPFFEKVAFRSEITVITPSNEICLFETEDGEKLMFFHIDGGTLTGELPEQDQDKDKERTRS